MHLNTPRNLIMFGLSALTIGWSIQSQATPAPTPRESAHVFISGHSLTHNPLGEWVGEIAESLKKEYKFNQHLIGGSPIRVRTAGMEWNVTSWPGYRGGDNYRGKDLDVISELKSPKTIGKNAKYDTLVITERHDLLNTLLWEETIPLLRHYHDRLIAGNPDARTFFYQGWLDINKKDPSMWITHTTNDLFAWECASTKANLTLAADGRKDRIYTLPTGAALVELVKRIMNNEVAGIKGSTQEKLDVIFQDNVHMTYTGYYYISLVTYSAIYQSSPVGADVLADVNTETGKALQQIAWNFIKNYYSQPEPGTHTMEECRTQMVEKVAPSFAIMKEEPHKLEHWKATFGDAKSKYNPFRWPDPDLKVYPAP